MVEEKAAAVAKDKEDVSKYKEAAGSVEDKEASTNTSKEKETCAKVNWCERSKIVSEWELALLIFAPK